MFVAMNRFKVIKGEEKAFEHVWASRRTGATRGAGFCWKLCSALERRPPK